MDTDDDFEKINKYINNAKELISKTSFDIKTHYEKAHENLTKALNTSIKSKYNIGIAQSYTYLGQLKSTLSSYDSSLEYFQKALQIYEELNDKEASASIYDNIGNVYLLRDDLDKALDCFIKSRDISLSINSNRTLCKALTNCGSVCFMLKKLDEALNYYIEALPICKELGEKEEQSKILSSIGTIYVEMKEYDIAITFFTDALELEEELNSAYGIAYANFRLAETYYFVNSYKKAIEFNNKALKAAGESGNKPLQSYCCVLFSNIYEKLENYKEALKFFKEYSRIREDVLDEDRKRKIAEIKAKFDLYKKEKENEIYKLKNIKLKELNKKLKTAYENAEWLANTDFLTRIHNRRSISQYINENFINKEILFTIILSDIDDFKSINDTYGHVTGDYVLTETVTRLQSCLEDNCKIARWGGEEFLIVLPNTSLEQGISIAERLRQSICSTPYLYNNNAINVTMTFGVSGYNKGYTFDDLIKNADSALYIGKSRGKNCVV